MEIVIGVAIVGLLATLGIPNMMQAGQEARPTGLEPVMCGLARLCRAELRVLGGRRESTCREARRSTRVRIVKRRQG